MPPPPKNARHLVLRFAVVALLTVSFTACDSVAPLDPSPDVSSVDFLQDVEGLTLTRMPGSASKTADTPATSYRCVIAVLDRTMESDSLIYRYGRINLHFDEEVVDRANGRSASWHYRVPIEGDHERMARVLDCIVPMSREVSEMMSRLVGHSKGSDLSGVAAPASPRRHLTRVTPGTPGTTAYSLSGDVPNADGYICPDGYDWLSEDQMYCVDAEGNLSLPNVMIFDDGPPVGGGDPGEDPCWYCEPGEDECYDPAGFCIEDGQGGGFPPFPRDPCLGDNPPVYCTDPCTDPRLVTPATQIGLESLFGDSNYSPATHYEDRLETVGVLMPDPPHQVFQATQYKVQKWDRAHALLPMSLFPAGSILVHVHPFKAGEQFRDSWWQRMVRYVSAPSPDDIDAINLKDSDGNLIFSEGMILEPDGIIFFNHSGHITDRIDRCGY